jgi:hypothetical protein
VPRYGLPWQRDACSLETVRREQTDRFAEDFASSHHEMGRVPIKMEREMALDPYFADEIVNC